MKLWDLYLEAKKCRKFYLINEKVPAFVRKKIIYNDRFWLVDEFDNPITKEMDREFMKNHLIKVINGRSPKTI